MWKLEASIEKVWDAIYYFENWPQWWEYVESVTETKEADDLRVGSIRHYTWKTVLGCKLLFDVETVRVEPPFLLEGRARGELNGTGIWELSEDKPITTVQYDWKVSTDKIWMNFLTPIARPFFKWNHDQVMKKGGEGLVNLLSLVNLLNCELINSY